MSRDTAGQPVTTSAPGKSATADAAKMPPVPGPETPAEGSRSLSGETAAAKTETGKPASIKPASIKPASIKPAETTPTATKSAATAPSGKSTTSEKAGATKVSGPAASSTAGAAPSAAGTSPAGAGTDRDGHVPPAREAKAPRAASEKATTPSLTQQKASTGPRRVRLSVSRLDPWSVMKLSFLLSIAVGIMIVVASVVFWMVLDGLHVFTEVNDMIVDILGEETKVSILQFVELKRVVSLSTMIAIVDVVLLTALSTIAAFIYNVVAALVGGVHVTLTDE